MTTTEHNDQDQLGISTINCFFFLADVAHMRYFMQAETKDDALYGHFVGDSFGLSHPTCTKEPFQEVATIGERGVKWVTTDIKLV